MFFNFLLNMNGSDGLAVFNLSNKVVKSSRSVHPAFPSHTCGLLASTAAFQVLFFTIFFSSELCLHQELKSGYLPGPNKKCSLLRSWASALGLPSALHLTLFMSFDSNQSLWMITSVPLIICLHFILLRVSGGRLGHKWSI